MGLKAKWEYFRAIYERYRQADRKTKQAILSEFCLNTHYHRKYAIRLLNGPAPGKRSRDAGHARRRGCSYGPQTLSILAAVWEAAGYPWSVLLKHHIPVKTDSWDVDRPGFTEIDLVSHSGNSADGEFGHTLNVTDIHTSWTESRAVQGKGQTAVLAALDQVQSVLPFRLLGVDSDNGSEFINWHLKAWCERRGIQLTRGRPYKKDDNAHVEQKNWTRVRKLLGWDRYDSTEAVEAINDLYGNELRLWLNLYLPSVQLVKKVRVGSKLRRVYDAPQTPLERVARSAQADAARVAALQQLRQNLNPFQLAKTIDRKLERIYRLANRRRSPRRPEELPAPKRKPRGREKGCGKAAAWKSPTTDFSTPLGNPAKGAGFPLSHSSGGDGSPVTFQMSRRATPGLHS